MKTLYLFLIAGALQAATISIVNPSFEAESLADGSYTYGVTGWTPNVSCCNVGIQNSNTSMYASGNSFAGNNFAYSNGGGYGYYQVLTDVYQPNTTYTFEIQVGHRLDTGFGGYLIQFRPTNFSSTPLATLIGATDPGPGNWGLQSLTYSTGSYGAELGQNIVISFGSYGVQTTFDQAAVISTPEPTTLGLVALSLIGLTARRLSRRLQK